MRGPLTGVRVADFTWAGVGGYCGLLWAFLGADVIKVETKVKGGTQRLSNPARRVGVKSNLSEDLTRNKRSVLLNLKAPEGVDLAKRLVSRCDLVAENFRPGVMARLGLSYDDLAQVKPDIVMVSMAANGQTGPERGLPGYAGMFGALSGLSYLLGYPEGAPAELRLPSDMAAGTMGSVAGVAGLLRRRLTGEGQYIDCANRESLTTLIGEYFLAASALGVSTTGRRGNEVQGWAPYNCFRARDDMEADLPALRQRWVAIGVTDDDQWRNLCDALALTELADDPDLATADGRWERRREVEKTVASRVREHDAHDVVARLQACRVPAGLVMRPDDLLADDHLVERGSWDILDRNDSAPWISFSSPLRFARAGQPHGRAATPLGGDSRDVFIDLIGLSPQEYSRLVERNVIA
jgi:benzylsuccinate CoA-transferase BbsF subunit